MITCYLKLYLHNLGLYIDVEYMPLQMGHPHILGPTLGHPDRISFCIVTNRCY